MKYTKPFKVYACCGCYLAVTEEMKTARIKCPSCGRLQKLTQPVNIKIVEK